MPKIQSAGMVDTMEMLKELLFLCAPVEVNFSGKKSEFPLFEKL